jgi:hypothetical protein
MTYMTGREAFERTILWDDDDTGQTFVGIPLDAASSCDVASMLRLVADAWEEANAHYRGAMRSRSCEHQADSSVCDC